MTEHLLNLDTANRAIEMAFASDDTEGAEACERIISALSLGQPCIEGDVQVMCEILDNV